MLVVAVVLEVMVLKWIVRHHHISVHCLLHLHLMLLNEVPTLLFLHLDETSHTLVCDVDKCASYMQSRY